MPAITPQADLITALHGPLYSAVDAGAHVVRLCSPFVGHGEILTLDGARRRSPAEWRLLTYLDPNAAAHGALDVEGLEQLLKRGVQIRSLKRLHAKIFLVDDAAGFVGSANLTTSGLGGDDRHNRELTVALSSDQRAAAVIQFDSWWDQASDVTAAALRKCARDAKRSRVVLSGEPADTDPENVATADDLLREAESVQVWIKAVYLDASTADSWWVARSWMADPGPGRPGYKVGDLALIYAKDAKRCNAVLEVTGGSRHDPDFAVAEGISVEEATRWPWITPVRVRLPVPVERGVPLERLGVTGGSLQPGHRRMPVGGLALALRYLCRLQAPDA
jgi:hypothetical protein